jgi:hypothetical protein
MEKTIISIDRAAEILLASDVRTIKSYVEKGLIPRIKIDKGGLSIDAIKLAEKLGVEDFTEPFINAEEARKVIGVEKKLSKDFCERKGIPFSCLFEDGTKGVRLLFRRSLLEAWAKKQKLNIEEGVGWIEDLARFQFHDIIYPIFEVFSRYLFNERLQAIMRAYLVDGQSVEGVATRFDLSRVRTRQLIEKAKTRIMSIAFRTGQWAETLKGSELEMFLPNQIIELWKDEQQKVATLNQQNSDLSILNKELSSKLPPDVVKEIINRLKFKTVDPVLQTPVEELDISVRQFNCLKVAQIKTLGDLLKYSADDLAKFRNFGRKSIGFLEEILREKGYSLKAS